MAALRKLPKTGKAPGISEQVNLQQTLSHQLPEIQKAALKSLNQGIAVPGGQQGIKTVAVKAQSAVLAEKSGKAQKVAEEERRVRGSEDSMVPNSEDEGSEFGSPARTPRFDLRAFAFVPA